jgi:hypothetical protein
MNNNGWDIVYACSAEALNTLLKSTQDVFHITAEKKVSGSKVFIDTTHWEIVTGGSAKFIVFQMMTSGHVDDAFTFSALRSTVRLAVDFINAGNSSGQLVLNCSSDSVQVLDIDADGLFRDKPDVKISLDLIKDTLTQGIIDNQQKLRYVFATITNFDNSGIGMKKFTYMWYQPINAPKNCLGFLGVLGVTDDRDISSLPVIIDNNLLYDNDNKPFDTVFLFASDKFVEKCLLPAMPGFFQGSTGDNYTSSNGVILNNGNIPLNAVRAGAIYYNLYITAFNCHVLGSSIVTELSGRCPIKSLRNAYIDFSLTSNNPVAYDTQKNTLQFKRDPNFRVTTNKDIPSWEELIGILSLGILNLVIDCVSNSMDDAISGHLENYSINAESIGLNCVRWPSNVNFTGGGLLDNLYIRGCIKH